MPDRHWEFFCAHANEVPNVCPCPATCGCRETHCKGKSVPQLDERRATKEHHERYRDAARRLYPGASVRDMCSVNEDAERTGAFLEIVVWIPRKELFKPDPVIKLKKIRKRAGKKK